MFHFRGGNPCVFGFGVADPFDQVLDASAVGGWSCIDNLFDFIVVHFSFNDVGWRSGEVGAVFRCFFVRGQKRVVKHGVNAPGWGKKK